eukprot:c38967_g1_i1.p1 GENE.c38967_g1_i1~~c38967_g1_i1.p1  ORF type:complete len:513 (+),score=131.34 c38967_g1_i1:1-1539(+)
MGGCTFWQPEKFADLSLTMSMKEYTLSIAIFGASGDLAKKKTYPALFHLFAQGFIRNTTVFFGFARSAMSNDELRVRLRPYLEKEAKGRGYQQHIDAFLEQCVYVSGPYDSPEGFRQLTKEMDASELRRGGTPGRLFYLALPPTVFPDVAAQIKGSCMLDTNFGGWNRVVVEKPFGHDLSSSEELATKLGALFSEDEVYRIDHYLGKELVQNMLMLRFSNTMFSAIWNKEHVSCVVITFKEPFGTEGRGGYFDQSGIIRDILQNHLLQVLAIVAMEPPRDGTPEAIRDEKTRVLQSTRAVVLEDTVVGQYVGSEKDPQGYKDDEGVPKDSITPTFATIVLHIDNDRWRGVPFILKAGKALDERKAEVRVQLRAPEPCPVDDPPNNELVIRLQPSEAIYMKVNTKTPGLKNNIMESELDLTYNDRYSNVVIPDAYERLLLDVIRGDHQHFVRRDELVAAWKIFTPILHRLEGERIQPLPYAFGSRGPPESDELIFKYGFKRTGNYVWRPKSKK